MLLWGYKSQIYLKMNLAMSVTIGLEISGISKDELAMSVAVGLEIYR